MQWTNGNGDRTARLSRERSRVCASRRKGQRAQRLSLEFPRFAGTGGTPQAAAPAGLTVRTVERNGHVGDEIVAELESGHYDLVVLGSRGHGRLTTELLGSVNNHVHYHSSIPTLTVDAPDTADASHQTGGAKAEAA